ncbi:MAG: hypothetical protein JKY42_01305, partial [Flavobacteriales bacterium]|nr:hypothetical protein [Flavobacteriales bacterium]
MLILIPNNSSVGNASLLGYLNRSEIRKELSRTNMYLKRLELIEKLKDVNVNLLGGDSIAQKDIIEDEISEIKAF